MSTNIKLNFPFFPIPLKEENNICYVRDLFRKKWVVCTPEEWVRQNLLHYLNQCLNYPSQNIVIEKQIIVNNINKRFDALVVGPNATFMMLIECKKPTIKLTEETFLQIANYNKYLKAPFMLLTNGLSHIVCLINHNNIDYLEHIPNFEELTNYCIK